MVTAAKFLFRYLKKLRDIQNNHTASQIHSACLTSRKSEIKTFFFMAKLGNRIPTVSGEIANIFLVPLLTLIVLHFLFPELLLCLYIIFFYYSFCRRMVVMFINNTVMTRFTLLDTANFIIKVDFMHSQHLFKWPSTESLWWSKSNDLALPVFSVRPANRWCLVNFI